MDPATDNNRNGKRVRIAQTKSPSGSLTRTAIDCAKFAASITIASLPTAIKPLAEHYFSKFIALKLELHQLATTKARLANEDFVPTSARVKFKLVATERVQEQAPAALQTLVDDSDYILAAFKADIKKRVIRLVDLEIKVATDALQLNFCYAAGALGVATSIHQFNCDHHKAKHLVITTFEDNEELLKHSGISSPNTERSALQEFFGLLKTITNDATEEHVVGTLAQEYKDAVTPAAADYKSVIDALFVRSWDQYLARKAETARQISVREFVEEELRESITSDVAMDLEEITDKSKKLDDYISSKVTEGTRKLQGHVNRLEKQVSNPKNQKGAQKSSASVKRNQKDQKTKPKPKKNQAAAPKAAAAANGSTNANDKNRHSGKNKQGKRSTNFARKQTQRS
jgi:hypothetical protein